MIKQIILLCTFFSTSVFASVPMPPPPSLQGKVVKVVVAFAPGGATDTMNRFMVNQAKELSGINFVIENRPGHVATIAGNHVASSAPDGLTILATSNETFIMNPATNLQNHVDPDRLHPVVIHALTPQYFYMSTNGKYKNLDELIAFAKANPEKFTVGCNAPHQCMYVTQWFSHFGVTPYLVFFGGGAEMPIALLDGSIDMFASGFETALPFVQTNRITVVGTTWTHPTSIYPDAAPVSNRVKGFVANNFQMLSVPKDTPQDILDYYNKLFRAAAKTPESRERFKQTGVIHKDMNVAETKKYIRDEYNRLKPFANYKLGK